MKGLRNRGDIEGQDFVLEYRWTELPWEQAPALAAELLSLKAVLYIANGTTEVRAAKPTTITIPIVTVYAVDPVASGLVASLAYPGGDVTGLSCPPADGPART